MCAYKQLKKFEEDTKQEYQNTRSVNKCKHSANKTTEINKPNTCFLFRCVEISQQVSGLSVKQRETTKV